MPGGGEALEKALELLSHRGRSHHELSLLLARRGFGPEEVSAALARLAQLGYLDDLKFARQRAHVLLRDGKLGKEGVLRRLLAHGLPEALARSALEEVAAELSFDSLSAARALLERRGLAGDLAPRERARAARLLRSRGFAAEVAERLLGDAALDPPPGEG